MQPKSNELIPVDDKNQSYDRPSCQIRNKGRSSKNTSLDYDIGSLSALQEFKDVEPYIPTDLKNEHCTSDNNGVLPGLVSSSATYGGTGKASDDLSGRPLPYMGTCIDGVPFHRFDVSSNASSNLSVCATGL